MQEKAARILLLTTLIAASCSEEGPSPVVKADPQEPSPSSHAAPTWRPDGNKPLQQNLAEFYTKFDGDYDAPFVQRRVTALANIVRGVLFQPDDDERARGILIGAYLMRGDGRLSVQKNEDGPIFRPDEVLKGRRGNCLGLSTAHLLIAEELGVQVNMVLGPLPLHACVDCGGDLFDHHDGELKSVHRTLRRLWGEVGSSRRYGSNLSRAQIVAQHALSLADAKFRTDPRALPQMRDLYLLAIALDPDAAPAHHGLASLSLYDGNTRSAELHITRALDLNPLLDASTRFRAALRKYRNQPEFLAGFREAIEDRSAGPAAPIPD